MLSDRWTQPKAKWLFAPAIAALCLFTAACAADTSGITPVTEDAASRSTERDSQSSTDSESGADDGFSVLSSLKQIPLSAADDLDQIQVVIADVDAAADQARIRRPADSANADQLVDFIGPLTGLAPDGRRGGRLFVSFPAVWVQSGVANVDEFVDELGFSVGDVSTFTALESPPALFVVAGGVSANPALPEVAPGVRTAGEGDDLEFQPGSTTAARPLGRPLRIAERDGLVALSLATDPIVDWVEEPDGATLAENRALAALASRLDEESIVSALLLVDERGVGEGVGFGWAADDDPRGAIVFTFVSAEEAQGQLAMIRGGFEGDSLMRSQPIAELLLLDGIEVRGSEIIATVSFPADNPRIMLELLIQRDGPFALPE